MPFASCFVCLGKGHLAGKCPKNAAKGVYPEGGECKICRGKDHLARDCSLRRDGESTSLPSIFREFDASTSSSCPPPFRRVRSRADSSLSSPSFLFFLALCLPPEQIATTLLPHSTTGDDAQELAGPIGADEDDFHVLKRKRHEVELEEQAEEEATKKRKAPRPASEIKKPVVAKRKVVAF